MEVALEPNASTLENILRAHKVIVCAGSGGVGKTTVAAALGTYAAKIGLNTLVLTVDPARRLATALGLDLADDSEKHVPLRGYRGDLHAAVIDSRKTFDQFISRYTPNREAAERILRNRLYQQMSTTLSGSQEFTSLERLLEAVESGRHDLVILDTPPTKHAMDFLTAPQRIHSLFQDSITRWFFDSGVSGGKGGFFAGLINRGTRTVLKSLEVLTGGQFIEELIDFFAAIRSIQAALRDRSMAVQKLLAGPQTKFFVVTSFDAAKLDEAKYLRSALRSLGYSLEAVVINRAFPVWLPDQVQTTNPPASLRAAYDKVLDFHERFKQFHAFRYTLYEEFARGLKDSVRIFRIPEYDQDIHGLRDLETLAEKLVEGAEN